MEPDYLSSDNHPVINKLDALADIMRQRGAKYTSKSWRGNFDYVSDAVARYGIGLTPAEVALTLAMVKEARIVAATDSGREDFEDDMLEDSYDDKINYMLFYLAIKAEDNE